MREPAETPSERPCVRGPEHFDEGDLVAVLTTQPLDRPLDYRRPRAAAGRAPSSRCRWGRARCWAWSGGRARGMSTGSRIRPVIRVLDAAPMREEMQAFLTRAADYTLTPLPAMLRLATRAPGLGDPPSMRKVYRLGGGVPDRMTDARRAGDRGADATMAGWPSRLKELAEMAGVTPSVVKGLVPHGRGARGGHPARSALAAARPGAAGQGADRRSGGGGRGRCARRCAPASMAPRC